MSETLATETGKVFTATTETQNKLLNFCLFCLLVTGSTTELTLASRRMKRNLEAVNYADMELTAEDEGKRDTSVV